MAGHLGHGQWADEAAVPETLFHPAVRESRTERERGKRGFRELLHEVLEVLLGVLAGLREVIDLPVWAEQSVARVLGIDQRALAALARRGKHHAVVIVRSGGRIDFAGHVGHVALPWQQRFAEHPGRP